MTKRVAAPWSVDTLFDPWGPGKDGAGEGRSPEPAPAPATGPGDEAPPPPDAAEDPPAFLRREGVPLLEGLVGRLELFGHGGSIQDLLDLPSRPSLRLLAWLRLGLMEGPDRPRATLELEVLTGKEPTVRVRSWRGKTPETVTHLAHLPVHAVDSEWLRGRVLDGLHHILSDG